MKLEDTIEELVVQQRRCVNQITQRMRIERSNSCMANRILSVPGLPKKEFAKAMAKSDTVVRKYLKTGELGGLPEAIAEDIGQAHTAVAMFSARQKSIEKDITDLAKHLPVFEWWSAQPGLAAKGLGSIVGEAGNIGTFRKAAGLWQRMGLRNVRFLACSTKRNGDALSDEEWVKIGYCPRRRAVVWAVVDSMLKHQRRLLPAAKDLTAEQKQAMHPTDKWVSNGVYGQLAIDRYSDALAKHPEWTNVDGEKVKAGFLHHELDMSRVVGKRILSDLLKEWKK